MLALCYCKRKLIARIFDIGVDRQESADTADSVYISYLIHISR